MKSGSSRRAAPRRAADHTARRTPLLLLGRLIQSPPPTDLPAPGQAATVVDRQPVDWLRHAVAAVILAVLGLVIASSFLLTTTTDRTGSTINPRLVTQGPDTTVAVPEPPAPGSEDPNIGTTGERGSESEAGTLDVYDRRTQSTSRQAVRDELAKVAAGQQAGERAKELSRSSADTSANAARQAETKRSGDVVGQAKAAAAEQVRLLEIKRQAEEAARLAALKAKEELAKQELAKQELAKQELAKQELAKQELAKQKAAAEDPTTESTTPGTTPTTPARAPGTSPGRAQQPPVHPSTISGSGAVSPVAAGSYQLSARWGATGLWARYHTGLDLSAPTGTPIRAVTSGLVISDTANGWAGNHVSIRHADGSATLYAHMTTKIVNPGTVVQAGQLIGYVGQTGRAFGPHLHFEYYPPGTTPGDVYSARDPWAWMYTRGVRL